VALNFSNGQYSALWKELREYWKAYGGWGALCTSPYLWASYALSLLTQLSKDGDWIWYVSSISILPNLVGFSLGGYAVMLAFGDRRFQDAVRGKRKNKDTSPYLRISASMNHFVVMQLIALIYALISSSLELKNGAYAFIGIWLLVYALVLGVSATLSIFFMSRMYDRIRVKNKRIFRGIKK
jgi:hypothetical protein